MRAHPTPVGHRQARLLGCAVALVAILAQSNQARAAAEPTQVQSTYSRLSSRAVESNRSFPADGQQLDRPGLLAAFNEGRFHPIVREDGRPIGLVFEGWGTVRISLPDGPETVSWQQTTDFAPWEQAFNVAYLRFSDATLEDLQGDRTWADTKDPDGSVFRHFEARTSILETRDWTRWHPGLVTDQLMDLFGGGHVGGHILAEFRLPEEGPANWLSYLHNPRSALLQGDTTAFYTARSRKDIPPDLEILASFGQSSETARAFDVTRTDIDITFPTRSRNNRNLVDAVVKAQIDLVALRADAPLKAVLLELSPRRLLCTGTSDRPNITVSRVKDSKGRALAAVHRNGDLFIPLHDSIPAGSSETLSIEYSGAMTQGIPARQPDTYFSELGPWAWYPRSPHIDRFASRVEAHLPRFMSAVAPGDLVETRKEKDGWHHVFEEQAGVRNIVLTVGEMVHTKEADQGSNPRIIKWLGSSEAKALPGAEKGTRQLLELVASIWGPYPYSTLHVVENLPNPSDNWQEEGSWSCAPPDQLYPWQSFVEGGSGILLATDRTSTPSTDVREASAMSRLLYSGMESQQYRRIVDMARQWWGHMVPERSYRDRWIGEALSFWTGLVYMQAAVGPMALKERLQKMQEVASEGSREAPPLATSGRMSRDFPFQVWARGPLIINWLVQKSEAQVFVSAMNTLINRASGPGMNLEVLTEALEPVAGAQVIRQLRQLVETSLLPEVTYNYGIDKDSGRVTVVFEQLNEPIHLDIAVQVGFGGKKREQRMVHLEGPQTFFTWTPAESPKKVQVDPMKTALVLSLKRDKSLALAEPIDDLVPTDTGSSPANDEAMNQ
ncbi:MAG TPA: hypothetical protein DIU15_17530 [Deltaproteobacteria bacterium]|nr:hypothetical protein [Deltaproteobacteria bacterium]HCP47846.1 hypothetical protein [Deltaproteobacteria bacterium]